MLALSAHDTRIDKAAQAQVGVLRLMGQAQDAQDGAASGEVATRLKSQPGEWLGAVLDRRIAIVPTLDDATRLKALTVGQDVKPRVKGRPSSTCWRPSPWRSPPECSGS